MPTVSVIVPNYNHGRFLQQRIESILRQTYQDFRADPFGRLLHRPSELPFVGVTVREGESKVS